MSYPRQPAQNPVRQAPKRRSSTVESIDVSTKLYLCRDCGAAVRLGVTEPLPLGWRVLQGATLSAWIYVCPGCAGREARQRMEDGGAMSADLLPGEGTVADVIAGAARYAVTCSDALDALRSLPDSSIDAIVTDPPYYRVKGEPWDRAWDTPAAFIAWIGELADQWRRVLKPNGSLYCFASPRMAARVEVTIGERFSVLNSIIWDKRADYPPGDPRATAFRARDADAMREYFDYSERIIFAEHYGADGSTPLGARIALARETAGLRGTDIDIALGHTRTKDPARGTELCRRWEEGSSIPSGRDFARAMIACGDRREYEDLRREYEDLRRPFAVSANVPYTDVWTFATVPARPGKHVCEKPAALIEHIVMASTRPRAVILDCFAGSGVVGEVAIQNDRRAVLVDACPKWARRAAYRCGMARAVVRLPGFEVDAAPRPTQAALALEPAP